jgi:hypothetical protein
VEGERFQGESRAANGAGNFQWLRFRLGGETEREGRQSGGVPFLEDQGWWLQWFRGLRHGSGTQLHQDAATVTSCRREKKGEVGQGWAKSRVWARRLDGLVVVFRRTS